MRDIVLKADATSGLKVKVGDRIQRGDKIGTNPQTGEPLTSPVSGVIKDLSFEPENHVFRVLLGSN